MLIALTLIYPHVRLIHNIFVNVDFISSVIGAVLQKNCDVTLY